MPSQDSGRVSQLKQASIACQRNIYEALDQSKVNGLIALDIKKAFDTVNTMAFAILALSGSNAI